MIDDKIFAQALEVAARCWYEIINNEWDREHWLDLPESERQGDRDRMAPILATAAPYLIAEGRRQAAAEIRGADTEQWGPTARAADVRDCQERAARIAEGADHG